MRIYVASDYRTREEQMEILAESGSDVAAQVGCSEHEAGLALDVYAPYFGGESFLQSRAGRLVNEICSTYGFIVRYPLGKEDITGISYEPWHLRYVGVPHAELMTESGLTLEEYIEALRLGAWYEAGEYLISRQDPRAIRLPMTYKNCQISPDGTGYVIVTLKNI
jgi:D-alanyl-D-alanine carboxypeptidase